VKNSAHSKFSKITEVNRVPQFIKTMNEEMKISLSLVFIIVMDAVVKEQCK